jgi:hypothetical protein
LLLRVGRARDEPHDREQQEETSPDGGEPERCFRLVGRELVGGLGVGLVVARIGVVGVYRGVRHGGRDAAAAARLSSS